MGKYKLSTGAVLKGYVSEYGPHNFFTDGHDLFCKVCEIKIKFENVKMIKHRGNPSSHLTTDQSSAKSNLNMDLCQAMVSANIPLNKLSNNVFRTFLVKYTK